MRGYTRKCERRRSFALASDGIDKTFLKYRIDKIITLTDACSKVENGCEQRYLRVRIYGYTFIFYIIYHQIEIS